MERATGKALSKSAASRMWAEKSREQLELLRNRPLTDADWLAVLIDGVWLTRELCVVVAVGIDIEGNKRVLDFEQGVSENVTVVSALVERLALRGVKVAAGRRLLVLRDGSQAIDTAARRQWPDAVIQECLVHAHSNVRDTDGDGFLDGYEVQTGKSPTDPEDKPALVAEARTAIEFTFPTAIGKTYRIEASPDMSEWVAIEEGIAGNGGAITRFYTTRNLPKRFLRVEEQSQPQ